MTLTVACKSCRQIIRFNVWWISDRVELMKKKGENIDVKCKCGHADSYHVNDITAGNNRVISILSSVIFLVGTPVIIYIIWRTIGGVNYPYAVAALLGGGVIPFLIYLTITKSQQDKLSTFNRYRTKR
jgi:hypothetical protein